MYIFTFPQPEKKTVGVGASNRKENEREKMCRLVIIECGLRLREMRNSCVKKNEQVNGATELLVFHVLYLFVIIFI